MVGTLEGNVGVSMDFRMDALKYEFFCLEENFEANLAREGEEGSR